MATKNMFLEDYSFKGEYAKRVEDLVGIIDKNSGAKVFDSVIELFITAAVVGCYKNIVAEPIKSSEITKKIFATQFTTHNDDLKLVFRLVLLTAQKESIDEVTRLNRAFRNPETDENYSLFEKYMLGGVKYLHDKFFVESNHKYEDYLGSLVELISEYKKEEDKISANDIIGGNDLVSTEEFDF